MSLVRLAIVSSVGAALVAGHSSVADAQRLQPVNVCVIRSNALTSVPAMYDRETGDTLVGTRRFSDLYPLHSGYAESQPWYRENKPVAFGDEVYSRFGLPRVYGVSELSRIGAISTVGIYAEAGESAPARIYIPVRPGCEFQPYTPARGAALVEFAEEAYGRRDYATARRVLTRPSLASDGRALALLGELHHFGYGVPKDTAAARRLYDQAIANQGAEGYTGHGLLAALNGDWTRAASSYRSGVARGSAASAALLAGLYVRRQLVSPEAAAPARLLRTAMTRAKTGSGVQLGAMGDLARLYEEGRGVEADAAEWFALDSILATQNRGDSFAHFRMGRRYEMGWGTWPDSARALSHYRTGARGGDTFNTKAVARVSK